MTSSTLQFVVAGALIAAWAWMLGRPILTNLLRRSRRDSVDHFRYQQAVLSRPIGQETRAGRWGGRRRPLAEWRAQPIERRRLQLMLGFAIATFVSLLLAIALRGLFIRLFALMLVSFGAYLGVAVYIGSAKLRRMEHDSRGSIAAPVKRRSVRGRQAAPILEGPGQAELDDVFGDLEDLEGFGQGIFDDGFYEPIPELVFHPLNLDASLLKPADEQAESGSSAEIGPAAAMESEPEAQADEQYYESVLDRYWDDASAGDDGSEPSADLELDGHAWVGEPILEPELEFESELEFELEPEFEFESEVELEPDPQPEFEFESEVELEPDPEPADGSEPVGGSANEPDDEVASVEAEPDESRPEPTFTTPPQQRLRTPNRNKARPIYIEAQLDEEAGRAKAVND